MIDDRYVGVHIAARRLGYSRATIYRLIHEGLLPARQIASGKRHRIPLAALERLCERVAEP